MSKHSKFRFPMPVYVATLASGEVVRISYGSPVGKPLDVARGRRCAAYQCGEEQDPEHHAAFCRAHGWYPLPPKIPATIVKGHVQYNGEVYGDTMAETLTVWPEGETPKKAKAGPTLAECRAALQQIVNMGNSSSPPPPAAMARCAAAVLGIEMEEAPRLRAVA